MSRNTDFNYRRDEPVDLVDSCRHARFTLFHTNVHQTKTIKSYPHDASLLADCYFSILVLLICDIELLKILDLL